MNRPLDCVVHAMTPTNVLAALCALETKFGGDFSRVRVVLVTHYPGGGNVLAHELSTVARDVTREFPYIESVVSLPQSEYELLERSAGGLPRPSALKEVLGIESADIFFYPHDVSGTLESALTAAYPTARQICFGDALGQVFQRDVHLGYLGMAAPAVSVGKFSRLKRIGERLWTASGIAAASGSYVGSTVLGSRVPHEAVLVLPVDQSGSFLPLTRLRICSKATVQAVFDRARSGCTGLSAYIEDLMAATAGRERWLVLTENWAESRTIDFDRELDFYCTTIAEHCPRGAPVFIKTHPGEELPRGLALKERLGGCYEIVPLDQFKRYPVELWAPMLEDCRIMSTMYPALSLKYLYNIDVVQPMDDGLIEAWFPSWTWESYKNSLELNMGPLRNLSAWNGRTVLWSGGGGSVSAGRPARRRT